MVAECEPGERCECSFEGLRRCVRVDCMDDADCAAGQHCARTTVGCQLQPYGDYLCTTASDQCLTHADCQERRLGNWCVRQGNQRACITHTCE